ncbi:DEAD/DEAH box helicase, partial [Cryobacterium sp. 10I5]|uniref:DEAD/DEAH box helicase n=1 Tax=Cryobacterium sp. 10I5 TaxID=3048581 RepID=UPI002B23B3CB
MSWTAELPREPDEWVPDDRDAPEDYDAPPPPDYGAGDGQGNSSDYGSRVGPGAGAGGSGPARTSFAQASAPPRRATAKFATAADALRTVFGYDSFRGEQAAIIDQVIGGGDAVVLMPTGGGKSLCYQIPSLVREGTGIVISPLIALMQDQVDALTAVGVRAEFLNSSQDSAERSRVERD